MPGIFGFVKSSKLAMSDIDQVADAMRLYGHFIQDPLFADDHFAAGRVHMGKIGEQSSPVSLGTVRIWVEGEAWTQGRFLPQLTTCILTI